MTAILGSEYPFDLLDNIKNKGQNGLSSEIDGVIIPLLHKLKTQCADPTQTNRLMGQLESNIRHLINTYRNPGNLAAAYNLLTPVEKLVASMVRQGLSTKDIATTLTISPGTVSIHRKHIRRKLNINHKDTNLRNFLVSLS